MKKLLIIAQSDTKGAQAVTHFEGIHTKVVFPGATSFGRHFDGVVIYLQDNSEINFIKDIIAKYHEAPIKAFLTNNTFDASEFKSQSFTNSADVLNHLNAQHA